MYYLLNYERYFQFSSLSERCLLSVSNAVAFSVQAYIYL